MTTWKQVIASAAPGAFEWHPAVRRVMVCLPLSERAVSLARQAMLLASRLGAEVVFAHVGQEVGASRRQLNELFHRNEVVYDSNTLIVERGSPPRVLLEIIEREGAGLVIAVHCAGNPH